MINFNGEAGVTVSQFAMYLLENYMILFLNYNPNDTSPNQNCVLKCAKIPVSAT